jgi:hypothetical protein
MLPQRIRHQGKPWVRYTYLSSGGYIDRMTPEERHGNMKLI